jgi:hypothetical protein
MLNLDRIMHAWLIEFRRFKLGIIEKWFFGHGSNKESVE